MIVKLWGQYQQNIQEARALEIKNEILKTRIEKEVAESFQIEQAMMSRWLNCPESPTDFCFTNPNAENSWVCLYCGTDLSIPR